MLIENKYVRDDNLKPDWINLTIFESESVFYKSAKIYDNPRFCRKVSRIAIPPGFGISFGMTVCT